MKVLRRLGAFVSWHRRVIAALCAALCVAGIVAVAQAPPPGVKVVGMARPVGAGEKLTAEEVTTITVPPALVTDSSLTSIEDAVGGTTAVALDEGQPLTSTALLKQHSAGEGRAVVPIKVPDADLRALMTPGTQVTLIMAFAEEPEVITDEARVVSLAEEGEGTLAKSQANSGMITIDVPDEVAAMVATLGQAGQLTVVLGAL